MINCIIAPALSDALLKLKNIVVENEKLGKETVIFCEDRLGLVAERAVCSAVGGTFLTSVYSFARFLSVERGKKEKILSSQGSAMVIRKIIEDNAHNLKLFKKFGAASAAQAVYDTIAILYSSRVSAQDLSLIKTDNLLLNSKLCDISLLYSEYENYLQQNGLLDRNTYLKLLPPTIENSQKIKNSSVILLGFSAFTSSTSECARAAMRTANEVCGIFIGGKEDIYTNEASTAFTAVANEFGGAQITTLKSNLCADAEFLRTGLFNPERYVQSMAKRAEGVYVFEAADENEELEFIAASIKKHVLNEGERYAKISVMLPDFAKYQGVLERVFAQYKIPFYIDRRIPLAEHSLCSFVCDYLSCVADGCLPESVNSVISSPHFNESRQNKDIFKNYILRLANFRGGAKREPKQEICQRAGFDYNAVASVREKFLKGLSCLNKNASGDQIVDGIKRLFTAMGVEASLIDTAEKYKNLYPVKAQFSAKVYKSIISVLEEAAAVTQGLKITVKEFIKILKSGFAACEISLIPPKADAVFVGDITATVNTGSNVVFAVGLTDSVPGASADCALLTDREILVLEQNFLTVSPKIMQVNLRAKETVALNICAFKKALYLSYPVRLCGEECAKSEIILYAKKLFVNAQSNPITTLTQKQLDASLRALPYYCSEKLPAAKQLTKLCARPEIISAIYCALQSGGYKNIADSALKQKQERKNVAFGKELFVNYGSVTPTTLETYFACPYQNFLKQGLQVLEREEGSLRAADAGNFIHAVLENTALKMNDAKSETELAKITEDYARKLLLTPEYTAITDTKSGKYTAEELILEAVKISLGAYEQIKNSRFKVQSVESQCKVALLDNVNVFGRIDRVDAADDMVRIIDYKTGYFDSSATKYYMGVKLQLPLYLAAASKNLRPVGAYYFPAAVEYREKVDGVFRLQGFMDGSAEVLEYSDTTVQPKAKSNYVEAYYKGRAVDSAINKEDFLDFIAYSALVARQGAKEMIEGNVLPSPVKEGCEYCKFGGSCAFEGQAEREVSTVKCAEIARIVKKQRGDIQ